MFWSRPPARGQRSTERSLLLRHCLASELSSSGNRRSVPGTMLRPSVQTAKARSPPAERSMQSPQNGTRRPSNISYWGFEVTDESRVTAPHEAPPLVEVRENV